MWIVVNIGCIECGVSSNVVGVFETEVEARAIAERCQGLFDWREGGQNSFDVFPVPPPDVITAEYAAALAPEDQP